MAKFLFSFHSWIPLFLLLGGASASAQTLTSAASRATGGSGRASVEAGDSIYINPATLPHFKGRHFLAGFAKNEVALSLSDNTEESALPGAVGYIQTKIELPNVNIRQNDYALALAEFVITNLTMGVTGHHSESQYDDLQKTSYRQTNVDIGVGYVPTPNMGIGAVLYNVMGERKNVPENIRLRSSAGLGFNYIFREFVRYRLDAVSAGDYNFGQPTLMGGMEAFASQFFVWRLGYRHESLTSRNLTTAGAGFNGPKFAINYAYEGNTKESSDYRHSIDLQLPF